MKKLYLLFALLLPLAGFSQTDTINVNLERDSFTVEVDTTIIRINKESSAKNKTVIIKIEDDDIYLENPDTVEVRLGNYTFEFNEDFARVRHKPRPKNVPSHWRKLTNWAGFEIGINGYVTSDFDFNVEDEAEFMAQNWGGSWTVAINPLEWKIKLYQNYIGITTGLGIEWNIYRLRNLEWAMAFNADSTYGVNAGDLGVTKSKFKAVYINAPLLLEFNTSQYRHNSFHIAFGVVVGWKIKSIYKQKYFTDGKHKNKLKGHYNMEPFRFNATVRIGYGRVNLFATYALNPMFRAGAGPELYQVSAGITLIGW